MNVNKLNPLPLLLVVCLASFPAFIIVAILGSPWFWIWAALY